MSYVKELIEQVNKDECPACAFELVPSTESSRSLGDPEGKEGKYCPCCGRQMYVMGPEEIRVGLVDGWTDDMFACDESHNWPQPQPDPDAEPLTKEELRFDQPHFVSKSCEGEQCICGASATHKIAEDIPQDEPLIPVPVGGQTLMAQRHPFTRYVCCKHFAALFGPGVYCEDT